MKYLIVFIVCLFIRFDGSASQDPVDCTTNPDGSCTCDKGYILDPDEKSCYPYVTEYYGKCTIDGQCEWVGANSICQYGVCMCQDGFRWFQGECKKFVGLGESCKDSSECFDGYNPLSLSCTDGKCACSNGYYQRELDCRKTANKVGDLCALDVDCQFDKGVCIVGKCSTSTSKSFDYQEEEVEETAIRYQATNPTTCTKDDDCATISNSECYDKTGICVCKQGYFLDGTDSGCVGEIGVNVGCKKDADCKIRPGQCLDGACYCRDYYFTQDGNRNCVKTMGQNNWNCLSREWCYALGPYSYCSSEESCQCSRVAELDDDDLLCMKTSDDPDICSSDIQCQGKITNSLCINEDCKCRENYREEDGKCLPSIGFPCDDDSPCTIEHGACIDNVCQCDKSYVDFESTCYRASDKLGGDCDVDVQCSTSIRNSRCHKGKCACEENYLMSGNVCYERKEHNSYCTDLVQCMVSLGDTFVCRNSACQCPTGHTLRGSKCESSGRINIGNSVLIVLLFVLKGLLSTSG